MKYTLLAVLLSVFTLAVYAKNIVLDIPAGTDTITLRLNQSSPPAPTPIPPVPTPIPPISPTPGKCPAKPSNVRVVNTKIPDNTYDKTAFKPNNPETVYAFKFRTRSGTSLATGSASAIVMTATMGGKTLRITACPGAAEPVNASDTCTTSAAEVATVRYATNLDPSSYLSSFYCSLQADTTYYMEVINKHTSDSYTCSNSSNCGFYFTAT